MDIYISGIGNISPQNSYDNTWLISEPAQASVDNYKCIEPEYKNYIDPKLLRRMSRIMKMSLASAKIALNDSKLSMPEAIIAGTGLGCIEDTSTFLKSIVENRESMLPPTAFIQSTHNTLASQIAITLNCHNYNSTYVNRWFSFESSLIDAVMQMNEGVISNALVGGVDETTIDLMGIYNDLKSMKDGASPLGEGAAFFCLSATRPEKNYGKIIFVSTLFQPENNDAIERHLSALLDKNNIKREDIDLVVSGDDAPLKDLHSTVDFKKLCGEYFTSSAFGLWFTSMVLNTQSIPVPVKSNCAQKESINSILLYNNMDNKYVTFILIKK